MSVETKLVRLANTRKITVTTDPQLLVSENPKRKAFLVYVVGATTVYITSRQNLPATEGIPVVQNASYNNDDCYGEYWILTATGTSEVRVEEDTD